MIDDGHSLVYSCILNSFMCCRCVIEVRLNTAQWLTWESWNISRQITANGNNVERYHFRSSHRGVSVGTSWITCTLFTIKGAELYTRRLHWSVHNIPDVSDVEDVEGSVSVSTGLLAAAVSPAPVSDVDVDVSGTADWAWAGLVDGADDSVCTTHYHYKK